MRRSLTPVLTSLAIAAAAGHPPAAAQELQPDREIVAHPRRLQFPAGSWQPPSGPESRFELAAGATGFLVADSTLPLIDIVVVARAGANCEPPDQPGIAQLTATLLRRGGTRDLAPDLFDQRIDELGVIMGSQPTRLYGAATLAATSDVLEQGMALLLDMIERPRFDEERLDSIKRNMAEGMSRRNLDPLAVLDREWAWLLYGETHFFTRPLRRSDLDALTPAAAARFHRRHWRPENLTFAVSGDVDRERLVQILNPRLEAWAAELGDTADSGAEAPSWPPSPPTAQPRRGLFHVAADIPQAKVVVGHRAPPDLPTVEERVRLEVLAEILGGRGAISRLNGRLRSAEGLVYRVDVQLDPGDLWPADYRIFFDTLDRNTPRALRATLEEIERLRSMPPHPEELAVVQRELLARQRQEFDTAEEAVGYLVQDWLVAQPPSYRSQYRSLLEQITPQDVLEAARRHLQPEQLTVLVVGRWQGMRGTVDSAGVSELERLVGIPVVRLPERDPLSLAPRP